MEAEGVDLLFLAPSADLEYLTGVERQLPTFGQTSYAHGWVEGAFFRPGADPVFVLPRMVAVFELDHEPEGELVVVNEEDDGPADFERVARGLGSAPMVAVGDRVWAETTLHLARVFTGFGEGELDSATATGHEPLREGMSVMFDFGAVADGYCSDFGRTIYVGDPPDDYRAAYDVMLAAQEAGRAAAAAGTPAAEVNAACRAPIEEAGLGEHFRHRMGHGIGLGLHERPFISPEEETPLEPGMTFTDEPSIIVPGRFGVRIEDIVVCEEGGGRKLGSYPAALVANG